MQIGAINNNSFSWDVEDNYIILVGQAYFIQSTTINEY